MYFSQKPLRNETKKERDTCNIFLNNNDIAVAHV